MLNEDQAREELSDILNGAEYRAYYEESNGLIQTWWIQVKEWFAEWFGHLLEDLFPSIELTKDYSGFVLTGIIIATIVLLLLLVYYLIRREYRKKSFHQNKPLQLANEMDWSYEMHLTEANHREGLEEYSLATRHMFLSLLLYFHKREWLLARIWKTNWEYYDELKKVNKEWANQFYHLALIFDEVTYGERNVQQEEYVKFKKNAMKWLRNEEEKSHDDSN